MVKIFAHRGYSAVAPENTLAAFKKAIEIGADGVEFDVQASRDGVPVVIHDESLERSAGRPGLVKDSTLADLSNLDVGSWFDGSFSAERIPQLSEVLELLRPSTLFINIELKTRRFPYPGLVDSAVRIVRELGLQERVVVSAFNHHTLAAVKALAPELACAVMLYEQMLEPWAYVAQHGFQALHPVEHAVTDTLVAECHARGQAVRAWTVDEREPALALMAMGVDGILTNEPEKMLAWRDG
ncbi:MAG: glycerophosphodiester phosphodiesterase [SAR324 cluster bacterium]|nr:glycerophosphodiester phosphodiesterase [SAR324 cluster bacterium]